MKTFFALTGLVLLASCKDPAPFEVARAKASELFDKKAFAAAAAHYDKSLDLKPDQDASVWDRAAFANRKAGQLDRAAALMEQSLEHRPASTRLETRREIARMYLAAEDLDHAETHFQKVADLEPIDEQALTGLAFISSQRGGAQQPTAEVRPEHLELALARYDAVIALDPAKADGAVGKRVVLVKYIDFLTRQKLSILADAESQRDDKEAYARAQGKAAQTQTRLEAMVDALK